MSGIRVLVVGAGAGGLATAVRLRQAGVTDVLVVDKAEGVGGVWRANTYPGAACDVPSHLYSLSFHQNPSWSRTYAGHAEILAYLEDIVRSFDLAPHLRFRTEVRDCVWDDDAKVWRTTLAGPDGVETLEADVVIAATGQLSVPSIPELKDAESFAGPSFHSATWDHSVPLKGKRVAVVGTGASAIQFLPEVAREAAHVDVYQRTPAYTIPKRDRAYTRLELALYKRFPSLLALSRAAQYVHHESLGAAFVWLPALMFFPKQTWKRRIAKAVPDEGLREALIPTHRMGCKRILRTNDWYQTLTRPNVDVVTAPISHLTAEGVTTEDGVGHAADVVIYGTGFAATDFLTPMRVVGREGQELTDAWREGARAYFGTAVPGFPNLFLVYGPGTNLGHNSILMMIESQLPWILGAIDALRDGTLDAVEVREEVESRYDKWFRRASRHTVWETGCESWYTVDGRNINNWPAPTWWFKYRLSRFDARAVRSA